MEVEYEITPDDLYAFQWRAAYKTPVAKKARRKLYIHIFLFLLFIFVVLPSIGPDGFEISRANLVIFAIVSPVVVFITATLERRHTRGAILELVKKEKPGKGQLGSHKVSLSEEGLVESTVVGESHTSWAGLHRVEQDEQYIFIYTSQAGAHIIPKRAFSTSQE